jgi:hypothetical protein
MRQRIFRATILGLAALVAAGHADPANAKPKSRTGRVETEAARPAGEPLFAIVSLSSQRVTVYDSEGWILRAPVSSGRSGYETPAGIYSILQKEADHVSNLYEDAAMPYMQRLTWSGIAFHGGPLPGYPASHGCVRLPHDFAQKLFGMTKLGMRVIIAPSDAHPVAIDHPLLFQPAASLVAAKTIAAAKAAEARAAAKKANAARLAAAKLTAEAARLLPAAEGAKIRAEAQLAAAQRALEAARSPLALRLAEEAKARAEVRLREAEAQLAAAAQQAPLKAEAAEQARAEAQAAEAEKAAALEAASEAKRKASPVSILISRKKGRLYARQAFQDILESPVTIHDAEKRIGTHVFIAHETDENADGLRWTVVSLDRDAARREHADALDRIELPKEVADRISEIVTHGSALIVSDEGLSAETGKDTDLVVVMSDEPQGAIQPRRRREARQAKARNDRPPVRATRRAAAAPPPYYYWGGGYGGGSFAPW